MSVDGRDIGVEPASSGPATDLSYSEQLVDTYGHQLRHVRGRGWLVWDGRHWLDGELEAQRSAKAVAATALKAAIARGDAKALTAAARMCGEPRIRGALTLAASSAAIAAAPEWLDAHPRLLNTPSGTVDLITGKLHPHDPAQFLTKLAGADYDPDARSDRWESCLAHATGGDVEFIGYLQRCAGYTAVGVTEEEILLFAQGPGASGKTTLLESLSAALGDYARSCDFGTFLGGSRNDSDGPTPAVARLAGARMAVASEVSSGQRFNTARLKSLTGGERIVARHLHRDPFEYVPQFTVWLGANERPAIAADDDAAWRRIRLLPFEHVVPAGKRDPTLKRALTTDPRERAAVLAWIVAGAVEWHRDGLGTCAAVERATAAYRGENDPLGEWLGERCALDGDASTTGSDLRASYKRFCAENDAEPCSPQEFARILATHGLRRKRSRAGVVWQGIGVQRVQDVLDQSGTSLIRARMGENRNGTSHPTHRAHTATAERTP